MHAFWGCWSCTAFALFAAIGEAIAYQNNHYQIHRLEKEYRVLRGRDTTCTAGWSLCAAAEGGDCCPSNYACASTYCYATTAGPTTACSTSGYYACGSDTPGMCCPSGYICRKDGLCDPPAGVTTTMTCPTSYFSCPASLDGGCCPIGMGCNSGNRCYSTEPSTYPVSIEVTTTNSAGSTITSLTTSTMVITPSAVVTKTSAGAVVGYKQSTVAKISAIETSTSSGGLNQGQLGGIIGGAVVLLIAIIVAAVLILRRLRKNAKILEESRRGTSAANETVNSYKPGGAVTTTVTEIDVNGHEIDPLMLEPPRSRRPAHLRAPSDSSVDDRLPSPAKSPGLSSGQSTPPAWPGHYNPVPNSDHEGRHLSIDSAPDGYYDAGRQSQMSQSSLHRSSYDSQVSNQQSNRHWSYASEVSGSMDGQHGFSELEASNAAAARRRASSGATRPAAAHVRRSSDPHQRGRSESNGPVVAPLSTLSEINELHGYYGPTNNQVGQTAARLESAQSPTTPEK